MSSSPLTTSGSQQQTRAPETPQQTADTQKLANRRPMKTREAEKLRETGQKAAGAFRTISEVADDLGVEQHVLRFWETKFSHIKPLKRGGGRRYYRPEDIALLKNIHYLLYSEGYTIKGVQKLLSATRGNLNQRVEASVVVDDGAADAPVGKATVAAAVDTHRDELQSMLDELKSMRRLID